MSLFYFKTQNIVLSCKDNCASDCDVLKISLDNEIFNFFNLENAGKNLDNDLFLGYEIVMTDSEDFYIACSWRCNHINELPENKEKINKYGLLDNYDESKIICNKLNNGFNATEPGLWIVVGIYGVIATK